MILYERGGRTSSGFLFSGGNRATDVPDWVLHPTMEITASSETAKEDNTFTDLYEEGYDFYETPAAADAE